MIKNNKKLLLISSLILLLPILIGLLLWNKLPETITTHWNAQGEADGWMGKTSAVFIIPAFLLVLHWFCVGMASLDPKAKDIEGTPIKLVLWICPMISLICMSLVYATALGVAVSVDLLMPLMLGAMFILIGNYMPKCKQNYSIGIKVPWALNSEENWNKTHRFAGKLWVGGGVLMLLLSFLGSFALFMTITLLMAFAPMVYSYLYFRKHEKE